MIDLSKYVSNEGRALPVFLLLDTSGSMSGEKINTLNEAVKEMINDFMSEKHSEVNLQMCIITFGGSAMLHTELDSVGAINFQPLNASGMTPLGGALTILQRIVDDKDKVSSKCYRPVIILVSDGQPNDSWQDPLNTFLSGKRTSKCERWALGIGQDADYQMLQKFLGENSDKKVFDASVAKEISKFFKFVTLSTVARTQSNDPNDTIGFDTLKAQFEKDKPTFDF
jgi:uncharacterized protein YegL